MTYKVTDSSLGDCYKTTEEKSSSTTTLEMIDLKKKYSYGSSSSTSYSFGKMTFGSVVIVIYINNLIPFLGLGYGIFKFLVSKHHHGWNNEEYQKL